MEPDDWFHRLLSSPRKVALFAAVGALVAAAYWMTGGELSAVFAVLAILFLIQVGVLWRNRNK